MPIWFPTARPVYVPDGRTLSTMGPLGTILNTDLAKYAGGLGAEPATSGYDATTLGAALNTDNYPNG